MTRIDKAHQTLKEKGLRMTSTRHVVLQLLSNTGYYFTIDQIAEQASERRLDNVTVYRIMQTLEELGLVHKLVSVNGFVAILPWVESVIFYIDAESQMVRKQDCAIPLMYGFREKKHHFEVVWTFDELENSEEENVRNEDKVIENENKKEEEIVHKNDRQLKARTDQKSTQNIDQKNNINLQESKPEKTKQDERKKTKKLHQKLREF